MSPVAEDFIVVEKKLDRIQMELVKVKKQMHRERMENQALVSSVQEGLMSVNKSGKFLFYNSQFENQFLTPQLLTNKGWGIKDVFFDSEVINAFSEVLRTGIPQKITTYLTGAKKDQGFRFFELSINPLRIEKTSEIDGAVGIFYDITDLKNAEKIRIDFVSNASHELRTPFTALKGYVEILKEDILHKKYDQVESFILIISENVNRLMNLVNDLLNLSALDSGAVLKVEEVYLPEVTDFVINELQLLAKEKEIVIQVDCRIDYITAEIAGVEQILRNLISNAIKYIQQGGQIQVTWERDSSGNSILKVKDNGPGISALHQDRIFERFYRVDEGRSREFGGTGLGLAIVKHIMQAHEGRVQLQSQHGKGCEFICIFPS